MELGQFKIGGGFWCGDKRWRCTDIGSRVVVAIRIDEVEVGNSQADQCRTLGEAEAAAEGWFNGPPYAVAERVFDKDDQEICENV